MIFILKIILENSNEELLQIKVLETILPMINPETIHFTDSLIENVINKNLNIIITFKGVDYVS